MELIGQAVAIEWDKRLRRRRHVLHGVDEISYSNSGAPVLAGSGTALALPSFSEVVRLEGRLALLMGCSVAAGPGRKPRFASVVS